MKRPLFIALFIYLSNDTKTNKYVDHEQQDKFACEHENTLKSMEFSEGDEQLCLLTVCFSKPLLNISSYMLRFFQPVFKNLTLCKV